VVMDSQQTWAVLEDMANDAVIQLADDARRMPWATALEAWAERVNAPREELEAMWPDAEHLWGRMIQDRLWHREQAALVKAGETEAARERARHRYEHGLPDPMV